MAEALSFLDAVIGQLDASGEEVADLTRAAPPPRIRWVEPRLGVAVDGDRLR